MKSDGPDKGTNKAASYYLIFDELAKNEGDAELNELSDEANAIAQIMQAVADVSEEPPQFVTST